MQIEVNGTRLWFDVDGPSVIPDGPGMHAWPTIVLVHGGPGGNDHSYFKPYFGALTGRLQVVHLDLRDHGRSARQDPQRGRSRPAPTTSGRSATRSGSHGPSCTGTRWVASS